MEIDRRAAYYARTAELIAADPLDFYARAERGRKLQARFPWMREPVAKANNVLRLRKVAR